jgi:hypothetical protein
MDLVLWASPCANKHRQPSFDAHSVQALPTSFACVIHLVPTVTFAGEHNHNPIFTDEELKHREFK